VRGRETAWRVLASEFNAAVEEEKGVGEKAASYLLSPLGARMSRVLLVGTLTPAEPVGRPDGAPFLRARIADPTGTITVTAGSFQPRALALLRAHTETSLALVVGRVNLFRGRDGNAYLSARAEGVRRLSEEAYRTQLAETVRHTLDRIELQRRVATGPAADDASLVQSGYPIAWVEAARTARARYPADDLARFRSPLAMAVAAVKGATPGSGPAPRPGAVRITRTPPAAQAPARSAAEQAEASAFLDVIDGLAEGSVDGYADLREAVRAAAGRGVTAERAEELLTYLEEDGVLEEPIVGKLRRA
jgi:RPA family protein